MKTILHSGRAKKVMLSVGACALVFLSLSIGWFTPDSMGQQPVITNITIIDGHVIIGYSAPEGAVDVERVQPNISREWTTVDSGVMARSWTDDPQDDVVFYRVVAVSTNLTQGDPMDTPLDDTIPDDGTGGDDPTDPADNPDDGTNDNLNSLYDDMVAAENSGSDPSYSVPPNELPTASDADNNHASATPSAGRVKLYWQSNSGTLYAWALKDDGTTRCGGLISEQTLPPSSWVIRGTGDINQDGLDDLIWQSESGTIYAWLLAADAYAESGVRVSEQVLPPSSWVVRGVGDVDKDGTVDLIWQSNSGIIYVWFLNADGTSRSGVRVSDQVLPPSSWVVRGVGDVDKDGTVDLIWQSNSGIIYVWFLNADGTSRSGVRVSDQVLPPSSWVVRGVGDVDKDGTVDLIWQSNSGIIYVWFLNADGTARSGVRVSDQVLPPSSWVVRAVKDVDDDGVADLIWQSNSGIIYVWFLNSDGTARSGVRVSEQQLAPSSWVVRGAGY